MAPQPGSSSQPAGIDGNEEGDTEEDDDDSEEDEYQLVSRQRK